MYTAHGDIKEHLEKKIVKSWIYYFNLHSPFYGEGFHHESLDRCGNWGIYGVAILELM